jgi:hypothetical protein
VAKRLRVGNWCFSPLLRQDLPGGNGPTIPHVKPLTTFPRISSENAILQTLCKAEGARLEHSAVDGASQISPIYCEDLPVGKAS